MILSERCLRIIVTGWMDHDKRFTTFVDYCDGMDGP